MAAGENRFAPELNEKEVIELLENTTPGSTKKATKYGMKIFQGKNFDNLSIRVSQSKTMQVETIYKLIKLISYISLTFSDCLLTPGNKFSKKFLYSRNKTRRSI